MSRRFEPGTLVSITMEGNDSQSLHTLMARVANVRADEGKKWILGCAFTTKLGEEEVQELV